MSLISFKDVYGIQKFSFANLIFHKKYCISLLEISFIRQKITCGCFPFNTKIHDASSKPTEPI